MNDLPEIFKTFSAQEKAAAQTILHTVEGMEIWKAQQLLSACEEALQNAVYRL